MKNLRIITLTAICMMLGMSLIEAKDFYSRTMTFINNSPNPISIDCQSKYTKQEHGSQGVTRHDHITKTIPAGTTGNSIKWKFNTDNKPSDLQFIKIKDTVNGKQFNVSNGYHGFVTGDNSSNTINTDGTITTVKPSGTTGTATITVTTKINGDGTTTVTSTPTTGTPTVTTRASSATDLVLK